jgi:hypothetical protein
MSQGENELEQLDRLGDPIIDVIQAQPKSAESRLATMLLKRVASVIDARVGRYVAAPKHTEAEWLQLGKKAREDVKAAVDEKTLRATARVGRLGASITVRVLANLSGDRYLQVLSDALEQRRFGQDHAWLMLPKAHVHPPKHAHFVLLYRAFPFYTVEYLVASGAYLTKARTQEKVIERLGITEDTYRDWRKAQNKMRRADFARELKNAALLGKYVRPFRLMGDPVIKAYVDDQDQNLGLPAVDACATALRAMGADKGRKA